MLVIPTTAVPNQQIQTQLGGQACTINCFQNAYGLFTDLYVGTSAIVTGVISENLNLIVRDAYLGFVGDLCWIDTQGTSDPIYTGLGTRWQLLYLEPGDLAAGQF